MNGYDIAGWSGFMAVAAEVAATLTGLIFVAVSINLARILEFSGLPERAAETIAQLISVLIISLIALVPGQSTLLFGIELAVAGGVLWMVQTRLQYRSLKGHERRRPIFSIVLAQVAALPFYPLGRLAGDRRDGRPVLASAGNDPDDGGSGIERVGAAGRDLEVRSWSQPIDALQNLLPVEYLHLVRTQVGIELHLG